MERPLQLGLIAGAERYVGRVPESVFAGPLNCDLIASVAPLYLSGSVLDVTYGRGAWWRRYRPDRFASHDLEVDGVDFRALPEGDRSWDTVCFDPPYTPRQGTGPGLTSFNGAYGLQVSRSWAQCRALIEAGLGECARVARRWVLVKCGDFVSARKFVLGHVVVLAEAERLGLRCHDLIVHFSGSGPEWSRSGAVLRSRRTHSYLLVFTVPRVPRGRVAA